MEVRLRQLVFLESRQEIVNGVDERMLVADDVARWPPGADVGVHALSHHDGLEALVGLRISAVVELEFVHALQIEGDAAFAAVNLEGVVVPSASAESRRLENAHAPIL